MRKLERTEIERLCRPADLKNGERYFRQGKITASWHCENSLYGTVAGSGKSPYQVNITEQDARLTPKCTCPAHRRYPFCKHTAALLMAWILAPERFSVGEAPASAQPQSRVRRARKPKVNRRQIQREGLEKVETLLVELITHGLVTLTESQVSRVADLAHVAESHKLRRLAHLVTQLGNVLAIAHAGQTVPSVSQQLQALSHLIPRMNSAPVTTHIGHNTFCEAQYADLLSTAWMTTQATRRALENPEADPSMLEDLVGKTWREKDLERQDGVRLIQLAYNTVVLDTGFTVDTSYLIDLDAGSIYTEKQIVPTRLHAGADKPSHKELLQADIGLYPGSTPRRIKLIQITASSLPTDIHWSQVLAHAESTVGAPFRQYRAAASPLAATESCVLFAPAQMWVDGCEVYVLDTEGQALPLFRGWQLLSLLCRSPLAAIFGLLRVESETLVLRPLSVICAPPRARLFVTASGSTISQRV